MKNIRNEKGLTLIVLAIMIVVIIILAAVTIRGATNQGTIEKARDTKNTMVEFSKNSERDANDLYDLVKGNTFD